jgi:hypothetical protein
MTVFHAYIDEAGDEGFKPGATSWFVLSAIVVEEERDREVAHSINDIKLRLWGVTSNQPLHWSKLKHEKKRVVVQELLRHDFTIISVAFEKKYLDRTRFDSHYDRANRMKFRWAMYFYATRLLAERLCRYATRHGRRVRVFFENRGSISYSELRAYLTAMTVSPGPYGKSTISGGVISSVSAHNKETLKLLQIADACSGALFDALEPDKYGNGNIEESYVLAIKDKYDRYSGKLWGYGIKLFPRSVLSVQREYGCYHWMAKI